VVGTATGTAVGVGATTGAEVGATTGAVTGDKVGLVTGAGVGLGTVAGAFVGALTGALVGALTGALVGALTGAFVGALTGAFVGGLTGAFVGALTGAFVGGLTGAFVGALTGAFVGGLTGAPVGRAGRAGHPHVARIYGCKRSWSMQASTGIVPLAAAEFNNEQGRIEPATIPKPARAVSSVCPGWPPGTGIDPNSSKTSLVTLSNPFGFDIMYPAGQKLHPQISHTGGGVVGWASPPIRKVDRINVRIRITAILWSTEWIHRRLLDRARSLLPYQLTKLLPDIGGFPRLSLRRAKQNKAILLDGTLLETCLSVRIFATPKFLDFRSTKLA
jgi:hypothetical protein